MITLLPTDDGEGFRAPGQRDMELDGRVWVGVEDDDMLVLKAFDQQRTGDDTWLKATAGESSLIADSG